MAGHSKWANIKRQKARVDAKKGKTFTQLSRAIIVAARNGIADPDGNFQLRTAVDKAKAAGMPNDNIDRAIAKGAGTYNDDSVLEEVRYEGYGIGGVAILIEALTDNRNRTAAYLREAFSKNGGNLGETGCVSWMFAQKGVIVIEGKTEEEKLLEICLEANADSYEIIKEEGYEGAEVYTNIDNLEAVNNSLIKAQFNVQEAQLRWITDNNIAINDREQTKLLIRLMEALESLDDVQNVTANFEITMEMDIHS